MNNADSIIRQLTNFGISPEEGRLYTELLRGPSTHLRLSHATGINRTKVYRLIQDLEKRSLITRQTDDRGTFLVANDPSALEIELITNEEQLRAQRTILQQVLPALEALKEDENPTFSIQTYDGVEGFKQMLWHELKAKKECVIFGSGTIEDLVPEPNWAEKHRELTVKAGYTIRELLNPQGKNRPFTFSEEYMTRYRHRLLPTSQLLLESQTVIYNHTIAIYHWRKEQKVGLEIGNEYYAKMMRQVFESYWQLAGC